MESVLGVVIVYFGLIAGLVGAVACLKPLSWLGIGTRVQAAWLLGTGFVLVLAGWFLPATETRVATARVQLDEFMPVYQFSEFHSSRVAAPKEKVYAAIKSVTADEIGLFRTLTWIRRCGRARPEGILNAPPHEPILEVATRTSFLLLAEEPNQEIVLGTAVIVPQGWRARGRPTPEGFKTLHEPGFAVAAMNFLVEDAGRGTTLVTTETRVYATDATARRRFAAYWRTIYPGSSLLRYAWLRAIKRRAESGS
jgi:hypothetical protein